MNYFDRFCVVGVLRSLLLGHLGNGGENSATYIIFFVTSVIAIAAASYFLGGINFAIIISKKKFGKDIRDFGSGNPGMTNMMRTFGKKVGLLTFAGDVGKSVVSCIIGYIFLGRLGAFIGGLFCMVGHMFPAKYKFKGGKGVSCAIGAILMTDLGNPFMYHIPLIFIITMGIWVAVFLVSKYPSLSAIMSMLLYPMVLNVFEQVALSNIKDVEWAIQDPSVSMYMIDFAYYMIIALLMTVLVVFMHRANIMRMFRGEEPKTHIGKKKATPLYEQESDGTDSEDAPKKEAGNKKKSKNRKK